MRCLLFFGKLSAKNLELCPTYANVTILRNIFNENFYCFNILSLQIFFGFSVKKKLSIFKARTRARELFCLQINRNWALFVFGACVRKASPNGQQHRMLVMPCWFAMFVTAFCNENVLHLREKKILCIC